MGLFRKRCEWPVEAEGVASLLLRAARDWQALPSWMRDAYEQGEVLFLADSVRIHTEAGWLEGQKGDWVILENGGTVRVMCGDLFRAAYEALPT